MLRVLLEHDLKCEKHQKYTCNTCSRKNETYHVEALYIWVQLETINHESIH